MTTFLQDESNNVLLSNRITIVICSTVRLKSEVHAADLCI